MNDRPPPPGDPAESGLELTRFAPEAPYGNAVGAMHRALEILELFAVAQQPLTVGEVCDKLKYPQSSTSVLLHNLADLGYLEHDRHARTFQPTLRVAFLGMWIHHRAIEQGSLLEFMESLASETGQVALLGLQNGLYAQYIHIVAARSSRVGLKPGLLRPICRTAMGKVLLSLKSDDEVRRIVRHANAVETLYPTPVNDDLLLAELQEVRRTGFAETLSGVTPGAAVIAAHVPVDFGGAPLAVGVAMHDNEVEALRPVVTGLIAGALAKHFASGPEQSGARRPPVRAQQAGYQVLRKL